MSRSHKYHTFGTICGGRNKKDKRIANRRFRRHNNLAIKHNNLAIKHNIDRLLYRLRECSDVWDFSTDGLAYYQDPKKLKRFRMWRDISDWELKEIYRKLMSK